MFSAARHLVHRRANSLVLKVTYYGSARTRRGSRSRWLLQGMRRDFTVLALESSADDTCAAVVTSEREVLANVVLNQSATIEEHGGIEPYIAIQEHQRKMPIAVRRALSDANLTMSQIDGIAFTRGPGMAGCLSVCANAAKTLAAALDKPLVGVHHMQAHALTPLLTAPTPSSSPTFPFLTLLISGGHTLLLLALSHQKFKILATTADEAVGRAIDKVARELRLEWSGRAPGAALEVFCRDGVRILGVKEEDVPNVEPMKLPFRNELKFSFSGLHSSVHRYILEHGVPLEPCPLEESSTSAGETKRKRDTTRKNRARLRLPDAHRLAIARAFQTTAVAQLEEKVVLALRWCAENRLDILSGVPDDQQCSQGKVPVRHVVVSGGVASNMFFRQRLQACLSENFPDEDLTLVFPPPSLCTDNAAMIAWASMHRFLAGESDDYSIDHKAKWSIEELGNA